MNKQNEGLHTSKKLLNCVKGSVQLGLLGVALLASGCATVQGEQQLSREDANNIVTHMAEIRRDAIELANLHADERLRTVAQNRVVMLSQVVRKSATNNQL